MPTLLARLCCCAVSVSFELKRLRQSYVVVTLNWVTRPPVCLFIYLQYLSVSQNWRPCCCHVVGVCHLCLSVQRHVTGWRAHAKDCGRLELLTADAFARTRSHPHANVTYLIVPVCVRVCVWMCVRVFVCENLCVYRTSTSVQTSCDPLVAANQGLLLRQHVKPPRVCKS